MTMDKLLILVLVLVSISQVLGLYEVSNLACTSPSSTSLEFTWSRPSDPSRNVIGYKLNLQRTDNLIVDVIPEQNVNDYYTETYTYGGLGNYGIYTFTLNTYTASGNEPTQTVICRTLTDVPAQAPATVEAVGISYTEIVVDWSEIEQKDRCGVLLGYKILYYKYVSAYPATITVDNSTFQHTITGLDFDTYYLVGVKGFTSAGDGPVTTDSNKTLGLPTKPPEVVTKYYCYEAIPGLITIDWDGMPCTVYVGAIGFFFVFCCIFGAGCCIACCSKKPPVDPDADMAGGGRGRGNHVGPLYDTESYYNDEYDEKRHKKSIGNVTARDVWLSSPGPSEFGDSCDGTPIPPKPSIMPKVGKMDDDDDDYEEDDENSSRKDDDRDSVYFSDESPPGTPRTVNTMERLSLDDLEDEEGSIASGDQTEHDDNRSSDTRNDDDMSNNTGDDDDRTSYSRHTDDMSNDGLDDMSNDGIDDMSNDGLDDMSNDGIDDMSNDGNDDMSNDGNDDMSNDGIDDMSNDGNDDMTNDGNDDMSNDGNDDMSNDGTDDISNDENDDISNDGTDDISNDGSEENDEDTLPPGVISVKSENKNIFDIQEETPTDMEPGHLKLDNMFLCKIRNKDESKMKQAGSKVMKMNAAVKGMQKNIFDMKKDEKPPDMTPGHFKLDNMFLCKMRKKEPKMKRVASDVMMANMATNAMKPKSLPKNNSAPDFGASKPDMNRPGNATERSNLGQNKVQPDNSDQGLGGEHFYKLDSLFLIGKNKQNKNVKANMNKDFANNTPQP